MILEVADFRTPSAEDFEAAMRELVPVIASSAGYLGHTVQRSVETPGRYLLIVRWVSMEAHTHGFRGSAAFERWRTRLGDHRNGAVVEHFETLVENGWALEP